MARKLQDSSLSSRATREKLKARKKPYYRLIDQGCHFGYYKGSLSSSWLARRFNNAKRYEEIKLGTADDKRDADGIEVLSFSQARAKAEDWFTKKARYEAGIHTIGPYTISNALEDYKLAYQQRGGKSVKDLVTRINALILPVFGEIKAERLTTKQIRDWHNDLANTPSRLRSRWNTPQKYQNVSTDPEVFRQRKTTANRTLTILKAALNYAFQEGKIATDEAWRRAKPFREVDTAKIQYLSHEEARRLFNTCDIEFRPLVQAALLTGCRYGELVALICNDFDVKAETVTIRISKSGKVRHVALSEEGTSFFSKVTMGLNGKDLIFTRANGKPWGKSHQQRPLSLACQKAKIEPAVTFHILRHTYATHLVQAGAPLTVIAANLGHADTRMTAKHYAHLAPSYVADVIRASMPVLGNLDMVPTKIISIQR